MARGECRFSLGRDPRILRNGRRRPADQRHVPRRSGADRAPHVADLCGTAIQDRIPMKRSHFPLCTALLVLGCSVKSAPPPEQIGPCSGRCIADPVPHCVRADSSCANGNDCSSGLTCARVLSTTTCATQADTMPTCRPTHFNRLMLQMGFGVGGMPISIDTTAADPSVQWQAPEHAEFMACALFSCSPSFFPIGQSPDDEDELSKIMNFKQCVVLFGAFPAAQSAFVLSRES